MDQLDDGEMRIALLIDADNAPGSASVDAFAIVSSDADFTPLVMRILTDGVKVYGFGEKKTPGPLVNACSQFTYVEGLGQPRNYGYQRLRDLIEATGLFEVDRQDKVVLVRDKRPDGRARTQIDRK
jgi:uncharacterized LabA/DUF88 family protein